MASTDPMWMTKSIRWAAVLLALGVVLGCSSRNGEAAAPGPSSGPAAGGARERTVHVALRVAVADIAAAARRARAAVVARDGYVESGNEHSSGALFELRVPAAELSALRTELGHLGDVESETEEATDVTAEHVELSARIVSAHAEEARLLELMANHTADLRDVLSVEQELTRVSGAIEQLEASERDLGARVAMASVSIELTPVTTEFAEAPLAELASAARGGITFARSLGLAIAMAVAALVPSFALLAALVLLTRRAFRVFSSLSARATSESAR